MGIEIKELPEVPELSALLREVHRQYRSEVVNQGKSYQRFAEDYICAHLAVPVHHSVEGVAAFNREIALRSKVRRMLVLREDLVGSFFRRPTLSDEDLQRLVSAFDRDEPVRSHPSAACRLAGDCDCQAVVDALNALGLLKERISVGEFQSLVRNGRPCGCYTATSNTLVAFFLSRLSNLRIIPREWQSIVCRYQKLRSVHGRPMNPSDLSTPLARLTPAKMGRKEYLDIDVALKNALNIC